MGDSQDSPVQRGQPKPFGADCFIGAELLWVLSGVQALAVAVFVGPQWDGSGEQRAHRWAKPPVW